MVWCRSALAAAEGADALCLLTEWEEFASIDLKKVKSLLKYPIIVDGRNVFQEEQLQEMQFGYYPVGRRKGLHDEHCVLGQ
ncbi:UDP-glucose 6-dehydrogenase TuaD [compost metagenome]